MARGARRRIVVLGGGFAGVGCARRLRRLFRGDPGTEIAMVSEDNFLLFTPMLPQVASGTIETRHIVTPIRTICRGVRFYEGRVRNVDPHGKAVNVWGTRERRGISLHYDFLVVALGSQTNFFGLGDVERNAYTMKTLNDAALLRNRAIDMLEQAENESDPVLRRSLLTFVVVGGGFAGIETAGELMDLLHDASKHYPGIRAGDVSVVVLEALGGILPGFGGGLADFALGRMAGRGIDIRLRTAVTGFDGREVAVRGPGGDGAISTRTLVWTAGVTPANTIRRSMFRTEGGKIAVNGRLEVPGFPGVFAIGDCALSADPETGRPRPPTAQLAEAQAKTAAANLHALIRGGPMSEFSYRPRGQMAVIGKRTGIASFMGASIGGFWAWALWRTVYLSKIPGWEKRVRVALDWAIDLVFDRDISRMKFFRGPAGAERRDLDEVDDVW